MKYITCQHCGANLDFGERCDCRKNKYTCLDERAQKLDGFSGLLDSMAKDRATQQGNAIYFNK